MASKRQLSCYASDDDDGQAAAKPSSSSKRRRTSTSEENKSELVVASPPRWPCRHLVSMRPPILPPPYDIISKLSDELLVRIFSYMDEKPLLGLSLVSKRFHRISADSQLWRPHYYRRFILPRAHRIPGFRTSATRSASNLHHAANQTFRADTAYRRSTGPISPSDTSANFTDAVDWKKQYKLRHNWARGTCDVDEVDVSDSDREPPPPGMKTIVKVTDGLAVTVDSNRGLRAWDLRTREIIAQVDMDDEEAYTQPSCLAVDGQRLYRDILDIAVGFQDGTFGIWMLDIRRKKLTRLYRHQHSFFGELVSLAYLHPYLLTATKVGFISLYSFENDMPESQLGVGGHSGSSMPTLMESISAAASRALRTPRPRDFEEALSMPALLTSLKSHSTRPPLTLSIRRMVGSVVASIAYTFSTVNGWSIGIQDLDIKQSSGSEKPEVVNSRVAFSPSTVSRNSAGSSPDATPRHQSAFGSRAEDAEDDGPIRLCYSHPYLLATMPDNTLVLYLCTSTATAMSISPGLRLWGHTSGISDAEITPRGKAVSVSSRGDEIRVWELEGRVGSSGSASSSSIEVRPRQQQQAGGATCSHCQGACESSSNGTYRRADLGDRRNWVGFDDEMVIVLKEARDGRESLMVYDFT
ncbi:hypothetical protein S40293_02109 [Stachybotrys chartarum IBT 40293]|nr:hypothetical protein S40293_02109 [Stachybotrys chartarum IBT 40293]